MFFFVKTVKYWLENNNLLLAAVQCEFDIYDKEKHLAQNLGNFASSKKGLNIIGSKMGAQQGFAFGHFFNTQFP